MPTPGHAVVSSWLYLTKFPLCPLYRRDLLVLYKHAYQVQIIVNLISHLAITNPLSSKISSSVIDADGELNNCHSIIRWNNSCKESVKTVTILKELIDIRDDYKECIGFSLQEIDVFMLDLCTVF